MSKHTQYKKILTTIIFISSIIISGCSKPDNEMDIMMRSGEYCTTTDFVHNIDFDIKKLKTKCLELSPSERVSCRRTCIQNSRSYYISRRPPEYTALDCIQMSSYDRQKYIGMDEETCIDHYVLYCVDSCIMLKGNLP